MTHTEDSLIAGTATADDLARLRSYSLRHAHNMSPDLILNDPGRAGAYIAYYDMLCKQSGLNTLYVICQTWHETGTWSSAWFDAPRRNPAGIGVNGKRSPVPLPGWQHMPDGRWMRGAAYPSYAVAAMAHVHGLALWAGLPVPHTPEKYKTYMYTPPQKARGSVTTLKELGWAHNPNKIGWAHPGLSYGASLARLANIISNT